ncbi:hypothetical protein IJJ05_02990 [Candidatus Saccharibacteria bacterium]|nr:hypothetical protein [Candidatus Saccharibacteria bacterium]
MGRFKSKITERRFTWGTIIFSSNYHITVITPSFTAIFHRFGTEKGDYKKSWQPFRKELTRRRLNSVYDVYKYANYYEVTHFVKGTWVDRGSDGHIKLEGEE